jgi:alpha-L-arabinofuranosidase
MLRKNRRLFIICSIILAVIDCTALAELPDNSKQKTAEIAIDANKSIGVVNKDIFGGSLPRLSREQWMVALDTRNTNLLNVLNELKPPVITIDNTQLGMPFYPESTGLPPKRIGVISMLQKMNVRENELGRRLFDVVVNSPSYRTNQPPQTNYDDILGLFERLELRPKIAIRVPIIFSDVQKEWEKLRINIDPSTGANLVHYLNDPPTTEFGRLRASNGHSEPYTVKRFVLGNEFWSAYNNKYIDIPQIAAQVTAFAKAMKAADASIELGINLVNDSFPHKFIKGNASDSRLLKYNDLILERVNQDIDFVTYHVYGGLGAASSSPLNKDQWKHVLAQNYFKEKYNSAEMHGIIAHKFNSNLSIAVDEYNGPPMSLGGALYNAEFIMYMLENNYAYAGQWSLGMTEPENEFGIVRMTEAAGSEKIIKRPNFYVLKLFTNYWGDKLLESKVTSPGFDVKPISWFEYYDWPEELNVPSLKVLSSRKVDKLYIMVVNRNLDSDIIANININNFNPGLGAMSYTIIGPSIDSTNEDNSDNVRMVSNSIDIPSGSFKHVFSKHSVSLIMIPLKL